MPELFILPALILSAAAFCMSAWQKNGNQIKTLTCIFTAAVMLPMMKEGKGNCQAAPDAYDYNGRATVISAPEERPKTYRTILQITGPGPGENSSCRSRIVAYMRKSSGSSALLPGDRITVKARIQKSQPPQMPGQFNYARYLERRGVLGSAFIDTTAFTNLGKPDNKFWLLRRSAILRHHLDDAIMTYTGPEQGNLIRAMVLGLRSDLDPETRNSFTKAGTMHILAVSGLHVSIVWMVVSGLLRPFTRMSPKFKTWGIFIEVAVIWVFAIITGFGPSIQRAAFMFSLISISRISGLKGHSVNLTAASAVLILVIRPDNLYDAGFQLSYAAVFGILLLYRKIHKLFYFRNRILSYIWSLEAVSFAAVIGTTPVSLFYFYQFPLLFPITNLIAVPASFLIVGGSVILFILDASGIPQACAVIGLLLSELTAILVKATRIFSDLPASTLKMVYVDRLETGLMYLMILSGIALINYPAWGRRIIPALLVAISCFLLYRGTRKASEYLDMECYNIPADAKGCRESYFVNSGKRQYAFVSDHSGDCYNHSLEGNHRHDHIFEIDSIPVPYEGPESLFKRFPALRDPQP